MEGVATSSNVHFCSSTSNYTGVRFSLLIHMVVRSMCQCSKYLCQSVVEELGPDVSTGLFIALTVEERGNGRGRSEGYRWEEGREGGRRKGMKDHCNNKTLTSPRKLALAKWSTPIIFTTLLLCNSS